MNPLKGCACQPFWLSLEDAKVAHKAVRSACPFCEQDRNESFGNWDGRNRADTPCLHCWLDMVLPVGYDVGDSDSTCCSYWGRKLLNRLNRACVQKKTK